MTPPNDKGKGRGAPTAASSKPKLTRRQAEEARRRRQRRGALIGFSVLLVGLFAGFAVAQGIGQPSIPSGAIAFIEDAPSEEIGTLTEEEFQAALEQTAARAGLQGVPEESSPQYEDIREAAMGDLLDTVWIQGEAADLGVEASERQVEEQLTQILETNFRCPPGKQTVETCPEFQQFIERSGFKPEDIDLRVRLQILSGDIQQQVNENAPKVSKAEIEDYYDASKEQFELPETRDIRVVLNRDEAKVEAAKEQLEQDSSAAAWTEVAREFSTDPASQANGGQRPAITEGLLEEPLNEEVFAAAEGEIVGPVKTPLGYYVFEVEKITEARTQELKEVQAQIRNQLQQQAQQDAFTQFIDDYGSKWQSRTFCAEGYITERCDNFKPSGHPDSAPAACYAENPKAGRPAACPAPVLALQPALPGTVSVLTPQGRRLPQRPQPANLPAPTENPLPGAVPGLPPGVPPGAVPPGATP